MEGEEGKMANEAEAQAIRKTLESAPYSVSKIVQQEKQRHPLPPFITSRLQQDAYRKLSFPAKKDHVDCPEVIRGCGPGSPRHGWVDTYMRTDSVRVSDGGHSTGQGMD